MQNDSQPTSGQSGNKTSLQCTVEALQQHQHQAQWLALFFLFFFRMCGFLCITTSQWGSHGVQLSFLDWLDSTSKRDELNLRGEVCVIQQRCKVTDWLPLWTLRCQGRELLPFSSPQTQPFTNPLNPFLLYSFCVVLFIFWWGVCGVWGVGCGGGYGLIAHHIHYSQAFMNLVISLSHVFINI